MLRQMTDTLKYSVVSFKAMVIAAGPLAVLAVVLIAGAFWWLQPNPPQQVTLATGPAQSAYDEFGKRYADKLRASGIEVKLLPSDGSAHNLELLRSGQADLAFVQGGSLEAGTADDDSLASLGSLFLEPVWVFYRTSAARRLLPHQADGRLDNLSQLKGMRLNVGATGSGVPHLMVKLLALNHVDAKAISLSRLGTTPAVVAFLNGEIDALVFVSAPESPMVQMLLQTPGVRLLDFPQHEAYSRRLEFLSPVVLPRGVADLATNIPTQNMRLVATTTTLLAQDGTHPALLQLFSAAAKGLHGGAGWFNRAREFPKISVGDYPMAHEAERYINNGATLLHRHLPFWLANLIERMWLAIGVILAVLIPLSKIVPPLYQFRIRSKVFKWYAKLRDIEHRQERHPEDKDQLLLELLALEKVVTQITVPLSYTDEQYSLLAHIGLVRQKISRG